MENEYHVQDKAISRVPFLIILLIMILLGLPMILLSFDNADFSIVMADKGVYGYLVDLFGSQRISQHYVVQMILQSAAFLLATITILLALIQYRLTQDRVALLIGFFILYSSTFALLQIFMRGLWPQNMDSISIYSMIWTFCNVGSGLIFIIGFLVLLRGKHESSKQISLFFWFLSTLFLLGFVFFFYSKFILLSLPEWIDHDFLIKPYGVIYLATYFVILFLIYPAAYKKYPYVLTNAIFYMSVTQILIAYYFILLAHQPEESAYTIAYYLKMIVYFIPFVCLVMNYIYSYKNILDTQHELHREQDKLKFIAAHDPLTDLYTRREFEHLLGVAVANHERAKDNFYLFLIDVDNFKSINDTLGHVYGDSFLLKFSQKLSALTRKGDIVSRIGGDEFTIIVSSVKLRHSAQAFAERILKDLNVSYDVGEKLLTGSASLGIAMYPVDGETADELLKNADIAMYNAKKAGKNTYQCFSAKLNDQQHRELEVESYLRHALENNELTLYFQPQYNLLTKEIVGAEVLLRWDSPVLGEISPLEFIPVAENSHLMVGIGNWVLQKACEQACLWSLQYKQALSFAINVSPMQFENRNFILNLKSTLSALQFPANYLIIEITETLLMKNDDDIIAGLQEVGTLGTSISLDDFGIGYSSLRRLQSLPINILKIDRLFVSTIKGGAKKIVIVDTIIKLAHELGMTVIAEGIETEAQLKYLVSKKCMIGQGFYLAKPMSAEAFEKLAYH